MSMTMIGTYKAGGVYGVKGRDGSDKQMASFEVVDSMGNIYHCQMWEDDSQLVDLAPHINGGDLRRKQVQLAVVSYSARMRTFKDGHVAPWCNFIVSDVGLFDTSTGGALAVQFSGTVKAGGVRRGDGTKKPFISFTAVDELGTSFPCQMWPDDPQFDDLAALMDRGVRRQPVQLLVSSYTLRERTFPDGHTDAQINFVVSDVTFPALATA